MLATAWGPLLTGAIALMAGRIERRPHGLDIEPEDRLAPIAAAGARP